MKVSEKRTQVYFPNKLYMQLEKEAKKRKRSVAALLREAAQSFLSADEKEINWDNDTLLKLVGVAKSREGDWAERHDEYLYSRKRSA